jgi:excisionase family DNA binding protein
MGIKNYLNVVEAARSLRIHPESAKRLIWQGDPPAVKVGNAWLVNKEKLEVFGGTYHPMRGNRKALL